MIVKIKGMTVLDIPGKVNNKNGDEEPTTKLVWLEHKSYATY